jgi:hypothetical protein
MGAWPTRTIDRIRTDNSALDRAPLYAKPARQRGLTHSVSMKVLDACALHTGQGRLRASRLATDAR